MSYREDIIARFGGLPWFDSGLVIKVDKKLTLLNDEEDSFSYILPDGNIIGFNKATFKFWRNCESSDPKNLL